MCRGLWPHLLLVPPTHRAGARELSTAAHHGGPAAGRCPAAALSQRAGAAPVQAHPAQVCCLLGASCSLGPHPQWLKVPRYPHRDLREQRVFLSLRQTHVKAAYYPGGSSGCQAVCGCK